MFMYLDESYNLKDRNLPQFISINGFKTNITTTIRKRWKTLRLPYVSIARIHGTDHRFEPLRQKCFHLIEHEPEAALLTVMQEISAVPTDRSLGYYQKDKLNFDKVYEDMLKSLFLKVQISHYRKVWIMIESRHIKGGRIAKEQLLASLRSYLAAYAPATNVITDMRLSVSDILFEMSDIISNSFYKHYCGENIALLETLLSTKTVAIKNPL